MSRLLAAAFLLFLSPAAPIPVRAQDPPSAEEQPKNEFFSGVITLIESEKLTVFKTVLGKDSETRTFLITKETRIEGKLRLKARVTVRYTREDDGNRALHIIVRTSQKK